MQIAANLEDLFMQLLDLGMYKDVWQTYLQVVWTYWGSTAEENRPAIIDVRVAQALIGVSTSLHHLKKSKEGLGPIQGAWSIFRCLKDAHLAGFCHELALTLNNMANHLWDSGLNNEAVSSTNEAVKLHQQLAIELLDAIMQTLLPLLNTLTCYSKLPGMDHQVLVTVAEAVSLSQELVATQPEDFEHYLGASLQLGIQPYTMMLVHTEISKRQWPSAISLPLLDLVSLSMDWRGHLMLPQCSPSNVKMSTVQRISMSENAYTNLALLCTVWLSLMDFCHWFVILPHAN